jgi:hypothetical protein
MQNLLNKLTFITFASLLVSACGGGGDSSPDTASGAKLPLSATDFEVVVGSNANFSDPTTAGKTAAAAAQQATDTTGLSVSPNLLAGAQSSQATQYPGVYSLLKRLPQVLTAQDTAVLAGVASNELCNLGGSITQNTDATSRSNLMPGDIVSVTANSCTFKEDGETLVINGTVQAEIVSGSFGANGPRQINTRMNMDFKQFQMSFTGAEGSGAVGLDGAMSILYDGGMDKFTSTSLTAPKRTTLTTTIKNQEGLSRHTISDFNFQYESTSQGASVTGAATVSSTTPALVQPLRYRWQIKNKLIESFDRLTAGEMLITSGSDNASMTVRFGQTCAPLAGVNCVTIQSTINGTQPTARTLTWSDFEGL